MGENISLKVRTAKARLRVHADPGMMEQVLMNLAVNARDAMPEGGELVIGLDAMELRNPPVSHDPGSFVRLSVSDTGMGIDPEHLPHIFEPFFTTKDVGKGSGLGLATVFGIVEQHGGWLEVDSTPGGGTTFSMFLPALRHGTRNSPKPAPQEGQVALTRGSETILLVEDDESLRALTRSVLEKAGYRVIEVETATAALALGDALLSEIDLLLTDLMMPGGTTGRELGEVLGQRYPALKVIYTSGYGTELLGNDSEAVRRNFLQKPYRSASLVEMVRRCLDEQP
jgi:CheY-like chemotaxis protein